jgi:hypothetical protein
MKSIYTALAISILFLLIGCDDNSTSSEPAAEVVALNINIEHYFGDELVEPDISVHTNSSGNEVIFSKLHYLLTDFVLTNKEGEEIIIDSSSAYINMAEGRVDFTLDSVPEGEYIGISFLLGVDSTTNHQNPNKFGASSPLNPIINNLYWDWMDGFIFCSVEGYHYKGGELKGAFAYHIGLDENLMQININDSFTVNKDEVVGLKFDMAEYFESPNVINITENAPITHSDKDADFGLSSKISENLLNAFTINGGPK